MLWLLCQSRDINATWNVYIFCFYGELGIIYLSMCVSYKKCWLLDKISSIGIDFGILHLSVLVGIY